MRRAKVALRAPIGQLVMVVVAAGLLAACGSEAPPGSGDGVDPAPDDASVDGPASGGDGRYRGVGTVLESPEHGPQLCLGGVMESFPPQCGGVPLVGWDWADAPGAESANGTTWGSYGVVGTYDGEQLVVEQVDTDLDDPTAYEEPDFASPCEPPAGGWAVVDAATTTVETMDAALAAAAAEPDYVSAWLDQSLNPAADDPQPEDENVMNDPTKLVLNVQFTGDLERHEAALREIWGGALCVSGGGRSESELMTIMDEVMAELDGDFLGANPDPQTGTVEVTVVLDADGALQASFDEQHGAGLVVVTSALQPVE